MHTPTTPDTYAATIGAYLNALPLAALVVDGAERIVLANPVATALFGAMLAGRPLVTVLRQPPVAEAIAAARSSGTRQMARILHQDGPRDTILMLNVAPVAVPGAVSQPPGRGFLLCFDDLTEREAAAQMRRDFVANVSHELRTPLTALLGFIETLQGPARNDPAAQARFLTIMESEAGRMNRLVQDLLSLSQVEAQERIRPAGEADLCAIITSTLRGLAPLAETARVTLGHAGLEAPCVVPGDADQIRQVLTNLVENGIKYGGADGRVTITLSRIDRDVTLRSPAVRIDVSDTGPGIDDIHLPRLTERFYRIDNHRSRAMGGTGLGLAIVKHIVNRHRGRLRIDSVAGQGSTFSVILPA